VSLVLFSGHRAAVRVQVAEEGLVWWGPVGLVLLILALVLHGVLTQSRFWTKTRVLSSELQDCGYWLRLVSSVIFGTVSELWLLSRFGHLVDYG